MFKTKIILVLGLSLLILPSSFADVKRITLKDGSVIRGELESFQDGLYTVNTENLGQLLLSESNVVSVASESVVPAAPAVAAPTVAQAPGALNSSNGNFSSQVTAMQNKIMGNPQSMEVIQAMAQDPEITAMMSDPAFVQQLTGALSGNNIDTVANDPRIQKLMANPKMQALIQQMQPAQSQSNQ